MGEKISVVINTFNEENNLPRVLESVKWVDEIIVCDMHSDDNTVLIAKKMGAKVVSHKKEGFVEPARNFAVSKTTNEWVLILDADEEVSTGLGDRIRELLAKPLTFDFVEIPRKNIIFDKWMKASMWWPDYHVRLFRKGKIIWSDQIHAKPKTNGLGIKLPAEENLAIIHHNYQGISQFIDRMDRYTDIEAKELIREGIIFNWRDLINKPLNEFLSRFFSEKGYLDGLHGLALSLLQALSFLVVYLKIWQSQKFEEVEILLPQIEEENKKASKAINYWINYSKLGRHPFKRFLQKLKDKI